MGRSTGNFAAGGAGAAGGGCGAPRSAPATPLQLEPHPRPSKHDNFDPLCVVVEVCGTPVRSGLPIDLSWPPVPVAGQQRSGTRTVELVL
ncbi:unnamed protein product, partial [Iphiclides podalirius]